ncbi:MULTISPECIES: CBS domain-containing protein [Streptomyces]|uniref:Oxidoreductase n=2 Tax=Streptomyces TaxID=1883 RepID=A0ABQ3NP91_STRVG|nr:MULTISPECIES: CBS domain-containing protein [Streptomyces]KOU17172.1 oxidoreductase [Streptomyces sp. WM6349]KOU91301.1 oxidoreductase [Streptomyces sp. XY593]KOU96057.1 oxidoreductase [Streptomyces sp. XY533]KOV15289.1 oxidoreductase [Streptomyces sp. XY511]KOV42918.1 oxidoreductase [Streptomyces sp. H036]
MTRRVHEVMTRNPVTVERLTSLAEAARVMRDADIGDVLVVEEGRLRGILTDRDLVVRGLAEDRDPAETTVQAICSTEPLTVGPDDHVDEAVDLMRRHALRRLPVQTGSGELVGIVTLGDLEVERDPGSPLASIAAAAAAEEAARGR